MESKQEEMVVRSKVRVFEGETVFQTQCRAGSRTHGRQNTLWWRADVSDNTKEAEPSEAHHDILEMARKR